jgi:molybdenum cofactor synthesis domain-containing protein
VAPVKGVHTVVITCSNRSAAGAQPDTSGALLADGLAAAGYPPAERVIIPDEVAIIQETIRSAIAEGALLIVTTGGTGLTPTDVTPEAVTPLLTRQIPGIAEAIRLESRDRVPTSVLSRGVAGTIGSTVIVTLPGSNGGVRDGLAVLTPLLDHLLDQIAGGDHQPTP